MSPRAAPPRARTPSTSAPSGPAGRTALCASWSFRPAARTPSPPGTANGSCSRSRAAARCTQKVSSSNCWAGRACSAEPRTSHTYPAMPMRRSPPAREAASPWQERSASDDSPLATAPRRRSRSSCAARATARARSTISPRPVSSTATGSSRSKCSHRAATGRRTPAQTRRARPGRRGRAGRDLLLRDRRRRPRLPPGLALPPRRYGRPGRGPYGRHRPHPGRLARAVHRLARPRHVLPQCHGGPGEAREWLIRDHPDHGWIRDTWPGLAVDPRLPLYGPEKDARGPEKDSNGAEERPDGAEEGPR